MVLPGWLSRNLLVLSGVSFLQGAASELLYPVLPIFLTVTLGAPVAVVGAVEGLAEGTAAVTKLGAGRLADRSAARRPLIGAGYGLAALGKLLVALAAVWPVVLAGRCVDRFGKGMRGAPRDALLVVGVPPQARGRAFGLHRAADTAGAVVGPLLGLAGYELLDHLSYALLSYPAGALSDRLDRHLVFAAGLACFAVAYLGLGLVGSTRWVAPLLVVYGGFTAATDGVGKAWVSSLLPTQRQGSGQGVYQALTGGAVLLAGIWAGLAWGGTGRLPLLVSGAVAAALAAALAGTGQRLSERVSRSPGC